jgi:hypothetical protein
MLLFAPYLKTRTEIPWYVQSDTPETVVRFPAEIKFPSPVKRPYRLCDPPSYMLNGIDKLFFPGGKKWLESEADN